MFLTRTFLEISLKHYADKENLDIKDCFNKKGHTIFERLAKKIIGDMRHKLSWDRTFVTRIYKFILSDQQLVTLSTIHDSVHGGDLEISKDILTAMWKQLNQLFEIIWTNNGK